MLSLTKQRGVTVKRALPSTPGNAFEAAGHAVQASITPLSGAVAAHMYGLRLNKMLLMLSPPETDVREGDGVCVETTEEPDYRVVYTARWSQHAVAHLQFIPEDERGADE